ncbi:YSC84-related protein [Pseudoalteromonas sp. MMG005]|uniref:lipid-binding SYLF domain-containing protein n=1 Tax=Pseudoalteromonas sp. MMG005 TaxID=2822682 RepID=UPI001B3A1CC7|nr:YSC84-related protein [Pseudoalteromonas sp. MMG005]MBQ4844602.1 hypothetical protein [Pseudoalteromonas sp. MMG005]
MMKVFLLYLVLLASLLTGCTSTQSHSVDEKRAMVNVMEQTTLTKLFKQKPDVRQQVKHAAGYAVFDSANVNVILASFGGGYGVVVNNQTNNKTYMNMAEAGLGLGIGAKDFNIVMVFHTQAALAKFIGQGWTFGGNVDAAAKHKQQGKAVSAEAIIDDVTVYSLTDTGLALQAVLKGTKFWIDDEMN